MLCTMYTWHIHCFFSSFRDSSYDCDVYGSEGREAGDFADSEGEDANSDNNEEEVNFTGILNMAALQFFAAIFILAQSNIFWRTMEGSNKSLALYYALMY